MLVDVLKSDNQAAAAQAAGALWSLCVDNDMNKQRVADAGAIPHLITLLYAPDTFAQSQVQIPSLLSCCLTRRFLVRWSAVRVLNSQRQQQEADFRAWSYPPPCQDVEIAGSYFCQMGSWRI